MTSYSVFHDAQCSLGEGLFVDNRGRELFWVDIDRGEIYSKTFDGREFRRFVVGGQPSALLSRRDGVLLFCNGAGIAELDTKTGISRLICLTPGTGSDDGFRSNDGVRLPGVGCVYGTMECVPTGINGGLYLFDGEAIQSLNTKIGIPNGFVPIDDSNILIADSFTKRVNLYEIDLSANTLRFRRLWHDFAPMDAVPDGGCTDRSGNVYFALWDGAAVAVLDRSGSLRYTMPVPVLRPTNCKLADNRMLYVTSARTGMTDGQLAEYPLSGSVLALDLGED